MDIMTCDDKVVVFPNILNFSYKLFVGEHVANIVLTTPVEDTDLSIDEEMVDVAPLLGPLRSHILKD